MRKLRIAVIGAGHLGSIHAKLLSAMPDVELFGVADPIAAARRRVAYDCQTHPFSDHRSLLDRVDAAVVAVPTRLHREVGTDFLRRGVHVLVEKPLAACRADAAALVEAAKNYRAVLQVGHVERFNPALKAAMPHLRNARYIEAVRAGGFSFRSTDIGVVLDLMIHDLDVILSIVRSPVRSVSALGVAVLGRHEDVAHARLEFENGCVANLKASRIGTGARREMQVWTETGYCTVDFATRQASAVRASAAILRREINVEQLSSAEQTKLQSSLLTDHLRMEELPVESRNAIADELADFVHSIRAKCAPRVDGRQGQETLKVAEQILARIQSHRWHGTIDGPTGPHAAVSSAAPILHGPHWDRQPSPLLARREAS